MKIYIYIYIYIHTQNLINKSHSKKNNNDQILKKKKNLNDMSWFKLIWTLAWSKKKLKPHKLLVLLTVRISKPL